MDSEELQKQHFEFPHDYYDSSRGRHNMVRLGGMALRASGDKKVGSVLFCVVWNSVDCVITGPEEDFWPSQSL